MFYSNLKILIGLICLFFLAVLIACNNQTQDQSKNEIVVKSDRKQALIEANRSAIDTEEEMIESYAKRYKWDLSKASGVYFTRYHEGNGPKISEGDKVSYHYTLSLINGDELSSSRNSQPSVIKVGSGGSQVSGLHRGMKHLFEGDKAKLIIPSHLAYGIAGNRKNIPPKTTLIYDLEILSVKKP